MIESRVARRYALALISSVDTSADLETVRADLGVIAHAIRDSQELRAFLRSPISKKELKKKAITAAFAGHVSALMTRFLELLCEKRRERVLPEIIKQFGLLYDLRMGIERPVITSAVELSDAQKSALEARLAARLAKKVIPQYVVDKTVLGGVRVQIGDTIIDSSVTHQLASMREDMLASVQ